MSRLAFDPRARGLLLCLLVGTSTVASAQARADSTSLDPIVVTATRTSQAQSATLPATTVITRQDIDDSGATDFATLMRGQAGVDIAQSGGLGSQTSLFLRGANSNQVLVLVDGLRVNTVGSGAAPLAHLMVDQIERIEVVRGNVSSVYGSAAIGGVIQIFTRGGSRTGDAPSIAASGGWGNERNRFASIDGSSAFGPDGAKTHVGLAASYRGARGFSAIDADRVPQANPDFDGYRNTSLSAHITQQVGAHELGVRYSESHGHLDFDETSDYSFIDPAYNGRVQTHEERSRQNDALVHAKVKPVDAWTVEISAGQTRDLSVNTSSNPASFVSGSTTSTDRQYRIANIVALGAHQATIALEHFDQDGFATAYGNGVDGATFGRHIDSAMAGYTGPLVFSPARHEFQLNVRHDRYSDFGSATTGLAAYGLKFATDWKAIVEASNAFKAPTFNELYFPFFGNRDLKAERARSVEVGLQYAKGGDFARLSLFRTRTRDLIVYDPLQQQAANVDRARVTGVEWSARTTIDGWRLSADFTWMRPIDESTRQRLVRRASRNARLAIARDVGAWRFIGDVVASGDRTDNVVNTFARTQLGGYALAHVGVRYAVVPRATVGVDVTNVFDRSYQLVDGYQVPGRVAMLTLEARY